MLFTPEPSSALQTSILKMNLEAMFLLFSSKMEDTLLTCTARSLGHTVNTLRSQPQEPQCVNGSSDLTAMSILVQELWTRAQDSSPMTTSQGLLVLLSVDHRLRIVSAMFFLAVIKHLDQGDVYRSKSL